ncbi:MAG: S8 family serine peptidase, partial [Steroidobacteraceae bacterium]
MAATGEEGIPAYQTPANDLDAGAPVDGDGVTAMAASVISETSEPAPAFLAGLVDPAAESPGASLTDARIGSDDTTTAPVQQGIVDYQSPNSDFDVDGPVGSGGMVATAVSFAPATFEPPVPILASLSTLAAGSFGAFTPEASIGSNGAISAPVLEGVVGYHIPHAGLDAAAPSDGGGVTAGVASSAPTDLASLSNPPAGSVEASYTNSSIGPDGATAAQVQQALDESGLSVNGSGIRVGVLSDSFNDLGGAAADEADGALPPAADIDVIKDLASGGTDEGRAMMQIIHDIAPGADLAFYTAFDSEQDFANGILALAVAGCKVIVDDVSYFDEPFFQNGVVAQAIQTVEAEGVTYVTAAGNDAENAYQAAWTPISGTFDGKALSDAESFGGSLVQTVTINTEGTGYDVPLLLEWNQAYGQATSDLEILVFNTSGRLVGTATNASDGEPTNPWVDFDFTKSGTYYVAIENLSGPNPGLIKEITEGDGLPATISGANVGSVYGHAMTPGAIAAGDVSTAETPAFGLNPAVSESFSSSGAGTELLFANNGTPLSAPDVLSPVAVSGVDDINTTVSDLTDFYGTSAAAASLAGVAALILSANPDLTPAEVEQIMEETALPMANSAVSGAGLVAVDTAVAAAEAAATPAVAVANVTLSAGDASVAASSLFTASAQNGEPITAYGFMDTGPGYFVLEGADEPNDQEIDVTAAQLSQLTYQSAPGTTDTLQIRAEDATGWSAWASFAVTAPPLVIQTDTGSVGSTSLTEVANEYFLYNSSGVGPALKYEGADVVAAEFGAWTPIGAVQTASGYDVAWEIPGANEYIVWSTDSNGNYISNLTPVVSGTSSALESFAPIFGQDLNGGGVTGVPTVLQTDTSSFGATSLTEVWYNYFLDNSSGSGPELKYGGADVVAGQFGAWTPIGAVQTASGYDVAWEIPGANDYIVWSTGSNGNYISNLTPVVSGTSTALESFESIFGQDLNGNGVIGLYAAPGTALQISAP